MVSPVLFSSATAEWATPQPFYERLNQEFGFSVDVCASAESHKCARYYDLQTDGLKQVWSGETWWCNPPYGRSLREWTTKAALASLDSVGVMLLPARTDTKWFHFDIWPVASEIRFIKGRLHFGGCPNPAPFPSMVVVFRPRIHSPALTVMEAT